MPSNLPYMASYGLITKILEKAKAAQRPEKFTQDFLGTKLGFTSGSAKAVIPFLKKLGLLADSGAPTQRYNEFRNPATTGKAIADGMREAYSELFERNEYANDLSKEEITGLVTEITGASHDDTTTRAAVASFFALLSLADFDAEDGANESEFVTKEKIEKAVVQQGTQSFVAEASNVGLNLSYTINLNLPETTNPEVFNAIFKSLKENLLKNE